MGGGRCAAILRKSARFPYFRKLREMARVFTIPVPPKPKRKRPRKESDRFLEGQRVLAAAIKYLTQADPRRNRPAITFLSEHFRTQFRMSDSPLR